MGRRPTKLEAPTPQGIEVRTKKHGGQSLRISFYYNGIQCRETLRLEPTKSNIAYAVRLRGEIINAIERGTFSYVDFFPNSNQAKRFGHVSVNVQLKELLDEFLVQAENTLQLSTIINYKKAAKKYLYPTFGNIFVKDLKPIFIRKWIKTLTVKQKTINNILVPLRAILQQAINDDLIETNPMDRVVVAKLVTKEAARSDFKVDPFNHAEIKAILSHCASPQITNLLKFAFYTGLRTSELIALEWQDIDWISSQAYISRAIVKKQEKCTKTEAGERKIMLLPPALEALKNQKQFSFLQGKKIFLNPSRLQAWETDHQIRRIAWIPTLKKAGIRYRNPYQTRHTYASMMLSAGENIMWVANQMGHVDTEMVMRTYGKWIPDQSVLAGYTTTFDWATCCQ